MRFASCLTLCLVLASPAVAQKGLPPGPPMLAGPVKLTTAVEAVAVAVPALKETVGEE